MENEYQNFYEQPAAENVEFPAPAPEKKGFGKLVGVLAAVAAIIVAILLISLFTNSPKAALKKEFAFMNAKSVAKEDKAELACLGGFCKNDVKQIQNIMKKSEDYDKEEVKESFDEYLENMEDQWGKNWKYSFKIEDKDEVKKDDLKEAKAALKAMYKTADEVLDEVSSGDYDDIADEFGITKAQAKKLVKHLKNITKKLKNVKVTKGYEFEVTESIKGKDDENDYDETYLVYKINGKWVSESGIYLLIRTLDYVGRISSCID